MEKNVGVDQSANDYAANAKKLDEAMNAPPTPKVPKEEGNDAPMNMAGTNPPAEGKPMADTGDGSYAAGYADTKAQETK